jgi:pimeloyl-ACP methyl ester carboxylesterase
MHRFVQYLSGRLFKIVVPVLLLSSPLALAGTWSDAEHGYADSDGVKIHYATMGEGPLVVMIHGFPDFWYTWRHQMEGLKENYKVVAIDQRGYNLSGQPKGDENYDMHYLVSDVAAVIKHFKQEKAIIVGHDWGGAVAWSFAFMMPHMLEKLIILNLPHPTGLTRELRNSAETRANTRYAQVFKNGKPSDPDILFGGPMNANSLSEWVTDPEAREHYKEAFARSDFGAMLAYYKRNYSAPSKPGDSEPAPPPKLKVPVLMFHGLQDRALPSNGLNNTWDWIDSDLTIVTTPTANHFVQQDAAELVTTTMQWWLKARP